MVWTDQKLREVAARADAGECVLEDIFSMTVAQSDKVERFRKKRSSAAHQEPPASATSPEVATAVAAAIAAERARAGGGTLPPSEPAATEPTVEEMAAMIVAGSGLPDHRRARPAAPAGSVEATAQAIASHLPRRRAA